MRLFALALLSIPLAAHALVVDIAPSRDTSIFEFAPNDNYGSQNIVVGQNAFAGQRGRGLFEFDVTSLVPPGATINSVSFTIGITRQSSLHAPSAYGLHRFLKDWTEGNGVSGNQGLPALPGQTTWNSQFHGSATWSAAGGAPGTEYIALASGIGAVIDERFIDYTIPSTPALVADVQAWLDNPASNHGWFMIATDEATSGTARRFSSTEEPGSQLSPRITVGYTLSAVPEPGTVIWGLSLGLVAALRRSRPRPA